MHDILVVISLDRDDMSMDTPEVRRFLDVLSHESFVVRYFYGESRGKIDSINRDIPTDRWDILVATADDMEPLESGWDAIIVNDMVREFGGFDGALHYNCDPRYELTQGGFEYLVTLPVIGRKLYERFGYIYHPDYVSEWCDNEQTEVFKSLGLLRPIDRRPIIHKWNENQDALMQRNRNIGTNRDKEVFFRRRAAGFPGHSII